MIFFLIGIANFLGNFSDYTQKIYINNLSLFIDSIEQKASIQENLMPKKV